MSVSETGGVCTSTEQSVNRGKTPQSARSGCQLPFQGSRGRFAPGVCLFRASALLFHCSNSEIAQDAHPADAQGCKKGNRFGGQRSQVTGSRPGLLNLIQPVQNGSIQFPRCLRKNEPAFEPVRKSYEEIRNVFGGDSFRENYYDGEAVTDDITRQLFIKSTLLRILAVLSANNLFEVTEKNHDRRIETIKTTLTYIQENYKEKIYIRDLADLIGMNEQYFCRFFKKVIGRSPMEYVNEYRIKKAIHYLKESDLTVTEICLECGYNNLGNFLREFRKYTSTTPLQYRRHLLKETQLITIR